MAWSFYNSSGQLIEGILASSIDSAELVAGAVDLAHMSANSVDSAQYVDGSIDGAHIANDVIDSQHYAAASIDNEHLADDAIGVAELSATGTASSSTFLRGDNAWAAAGSLNLVSGSYTGNGSATQAITGLGIQPKVLWINRRFTADETGTNTAGQDAWTHNSVIDDNAAGVAITGNDYSQNHWTRRIDIIRSFDSDGFTVGDAGGGHPNVNTIVYNYLAIG